VRIFILYIVVSGLLIYSLRDWFKCLCALIVMTAVAEHPDMPRSLFHIPGLNVWNALFLAVFAGWLLSYDKERRSFDAPPAFAVLGTIYALIVIVASIRLVVDPAYIQASFGDLVSEFILNTLRFVLPGLLIYDGCRNRERFNFAVLAIVAYYLLIAVQIVKWVPPWYALDAAELERRSREILRKEMSFYRTDLSMMMAGAAWACLAARLLFTNKFIRLGLFGGFALSTLAVLLTAGRAGYITWAVVGIAIAALRFRKALLLLPVAVVLAAWLLPGAMGRMREGFSSGDGVVDSPMDADAVSAGRTNIWPYIIEMIGERPWFGYGRQAMRRTGLSDLGRELSDVGEYVPHPHNSYLEFLFDCGWIGFLPVMVFFAMLVAIGLRLLFDTRSPIFMAGGGVAMSLILAFLVSGLGGRHFYPDENTFGMWCSVGLLIRTWVERNRSLRPRPSAAATTRSQVEYSRPSPSLGPLRAGRA
jgi:O-antigen ligase